MDGLKPVIVMGGAPSLPAHMEQCPTNAIRISCNKHAALKYPADYIAILDRFIGRKSHAKLLRSMGLRQPIISTWNTEIQMNPPEVCINTGIYAAWVACQMGAPVYIAGVEFYQGKEIYYHGQGRVRASNRTQQYYNKCAEQLERLTTAYDVVWLR